jgi:hypothetical protein
MPGDEIEMNSSLRFRTRKDGIWFVPVLHQIPGTRRQKQGCSHAKLVELVRVDQRQRVVEIVEEDRQFIIDAFIENPQRIAFVKLEDVAGTLLEALGGAPGGALSWSKWFDIWGRQHVFLYLTLPQPGPGGEGGNKSGLNVYYINAAAKRAVNSPSGERAGSQASSRVVLHMLCIEYPAGRPANSSGGFSEGKRVGWVSCEALAEALARGTLIHRDGSGKGSGSVQYEIRSLTMGPFILNGAREERVKVYPATATLVTGNLFDEQVPVWLGGVWVKHLGSLVEFSKAPLVKTWIKSSGRKRRGLSRLRWPRRVYVPSPSIISLQPTEASISGVIDTLEPMFGVGYDDSLVVNLYINREELERTINKLYRRYSKLLSCVLERLARRGLLRRSNGRRALPGYEVTVNDKAVRSIFNILEEYFGFRGHKSLRESQAVEPELAIVDDNVSSASEDACAEVSAELCIDPKLLAKLLVSGFVMVAAAPSTRSGRTPSSKILKMYPSSMGIIAQFPGKVARYLKPQGSKASVILYAYTRLLLDKFTLFNRMYVAAYQLIPQVGPGVSVGEHCLLEWERLLLAWMAYTVYEMGRYSIAHLEFRVDSLARSMAMYTLLLGVHAHSHMLMRMVANALSISWTSRKLRELIVLRLPKSLVFDPISLLPPRSNHGGDRALLLEGGIWVESIDDPDSGVIVSTIAQGVSSGLFSLEAVENSIGRPSLGDTCSLLKEFSGGRGGDKCIGSWATHARWLRQGALPLPSQYLAAIDPILKAASVDKGSVLSAQDYWASYYPPQETSQHIVESAINVLARRRASAAGLGASRRYRPSLIKMLVLSRTPVCWDSCYNCVLQDNCVIRASPYQQMLTSKEAARLLCELASQATS